VKALRFLQSNGGREPEDLLAACYE
jgi:hypothetical protein